MKASKWLSTALAFGGLLAVANSANAVPAYVRQTGFTCNQCHMSWSPTPDFTITGEKFRMNAYRDPFTAEKVEAGQEGAINGKRLVLGLQSYWTFHYRSALLQQSRGTYAPTAAKPAASAVSTTQFSSVGLDYAGPIGEHFGIWTEYYIDGAGAPGNVRGDMTNAEYTVAFATNPGGPGNIIGVVWTNQEIPNDMGFSPFGSTTPAHWFANVPRSGRILPNSRLMTYGFLGDRFLYDVGVIAGWDNTSYDKLSYGGTMGYALGNTDDNQLWLLAFWAAGNDNVPLLTTYTFDQSGVTPVFKAVDAIPGASAYRSGATSYTSVDIGDFYRLEPTVRYAFVDRGHHSVSSSTGFVMEQDKYSDGAKVQNQGWGTSWRYFYDRTIGFSFNLNKTTKFEFTDRNGVVHTAPKKGLGYGVGAIYRVAMNAALELSFNNLQTQVLDQTYNNGWAWNFSWHFLY